MVARSIALSVLAASAVLLPTTAHADGMSIAPDFLDTEARAICQPVSFVGTSMDHRIPCSSTATATEDGSATLNLRATTALGGRAPGYNGALGYSSFGASHAVEDRPGHTLRYRFLVYIAHASASAPGKALTARGHAHAGLYATASVYGVSHEHRSAFRDLTSSDGAFGPTSVVGEFIEFALDVRRPRAATTADVSVSFDGSASMSTSIVPPGLPRGEASVTVDAKILDVSVSYL